MPDEFDDVLERLDYNIWSDDDSFDAPASLRSTLGTTPSPLQISMAQERRGVLRGLAASIGATIERRVLMEGRNRVERTTLRDARGRFVARGAANVRRFLQEEIGF